MFPRSIAVPAAAAAVLLTGCASLPSDSGRSQALEHAAQRGRAVPKPEDGAAFTRQLLQQPLTAETAVQLALTNGPRLRAETARLGIAAAELYNAGRLSNPVLSVARLSPGDAAATNAQLTLGIAMNFVDLLLLPANRRFAAAEFEAAQLSLGAAALDVAAEVETAWYDAVGADQLAQMRETVSRAARTSADLAQRFFDAGNINRRELALEQAAASQASLDALGAQADAVQARSRLSRLMGLPATERWTLDVRLGEPLPKEDAVDDLYRISADARLDIAAARRRAQALAVRYGLERRTRLVNGLEIGYEREKDFDGSINRGPTASIELPLFNWGGGRIAAARAALDAAEAELDGLVLDRTNDIQSAHAAVAAAKARAETYRSALIPQREEVVAQMQREVNAMLIGVFELLVAKQAEYEAYAGYLEAVRDYWKARTELALAVGRRLPSSDQPAQPTLDPAKLTEPGESPMPEGMDHSGHNMKGPQAPSTNPHAGHRMSAPPVDPHAGHAMPMAPSQQQGTQPAPATAVDPHASHRKPPAGPAATSVPTEPANPHAGHVMPEASVPSAEDTHAHHH